MDAVEILRKRLKIPGFANIPLEVVTAAKVVRVGYALKCERCNHVWCFSRKEASEHESEIHGREWPRYDGSECTFRGQVIHLMGHKARVLKLLVTAEERIVPGADLVAGDGAHKSDLAVIICRLRRELRPYGLEIKSLRGKGYYLKTSPSAEQT